MHWFHSIKWEEKSRSFCFYICAGPHVLTLVLCYLTLHRKKFQGRAGTSLCSSACVCIGVKLFQDVSFEAVSGLLNTCIYSTVPA